MTTSIDVIQSVQDNVELGYITDIKLRTFDIGMVSNDFDVRIEGFGGFACNNGLGLTDMFRSK